MLNGELCQQECQITSNILFTVYFLQTMPLSKADSQFGKVPPASRNKYSWRLCLSKYQSAEPDKEFLCVCRSSHLWRPRNITGQRCRFLWVQRRMGCPEVEDLEMKGSVDACMRVCECVRVCAHCQPTIPCQMANGRGGGHLWGSTGQKGELAEQGKG